MIKKNLQHILTAFMTLLSVFLVYLTNYNSTLKLVLSLAFAALISVYFIFILFDKPALAKTTTTAIFLGALVAGILFLLYKVDFFDHVKDEESLKEYISSFGNMAFLVYFAIQFVQVIVSPIPGGVTTAAGVLIFDPLIAGLVSFAAIFSGSIVAFLVGRVFGKKIVRWIVGEEELKRGMDLIKGKDRVALTIMFLFPFFPDDLLCIVAGLTTISFTYFTVMVFVTRVISVATTSLLMNFFKHLISTNLVLGIILAAISLLFVAAVFYFSMKNAEKLEELAIKFTKKCLSALSVLGTLILKFLAILIWPFKKIFALLFKPRKDGSEEE